MSNELERLLPLLERWSQLAPGECAPMDMSKVYPVHKITSAHYTLEICDLRHTPYIKVIHHNNKDGFMSSHGLAQVLLEGAIREAIEKRGWSYALSWINDNNDYLGEINSVNKQGAIIIAADTTTLAVEALLSAYVQALEAQ